MNKPNLIEIEQKRAEIIRSHNEKIKSTSVEERIAALEGFCGAFAFLNLTDEEIMQNKMEAILK